MAHLKPDVSALAALRQACIDYINYLEAEDSCEDGDEDYENQIFEKALELIYGKEIWATVTYLQDERMNHEDS